jgi:hypothetical protein
MISYRWKSSPTDGALHFDLNPGFEAGLMENMFARRSENSNFLDLQILLFLMRSYKILFHCLFIVQRHSINNLLLLYFLFRLFKKIVQTDTTLSLTACDCISCDRILILIFFGHKDLRYKKICTNFAL